MWIKTKFSQAFNCIFEKIGRIASEEVMFALIKSKCLSILLYGTEACPINLAMRHSLQFALNKALLKIFGALSKDTYKYICKYFGIRPMNEQISARRSKFCLRYCASESAVCHAISKLRWFYSMTLYSQRLFCSVWFHMFPTTSCCICSLFIFIVKLIYLSFSVFCYRTYSLWWNKDFHK